MFKTLEIENFKCLTKFRQELGCLTLLTGLNASGKSSVIQALALLHQTASENELATSMQLNGPNIELGTMFDVIDRNCGGHGFNISVGEDNWNCRWETTSGERKKDVVARIAGFTFRSKENYTFWSEKELKEGGMRGLIPQSLDNTDDFILRDLQKQLASMCHIGAERIGPREVYIGQTPLRYPDVGSRGEKTPWCLEQFADNPTNPGVTVDGVPKTLQKMVEASMAQFFPGFRLQIKRVEATNLLTMGIRTSPKGEYFRPTNVGFGLSHVLPIVTACVAATPGQILLIENPETHLHPAGQSMIGTFLARAASMGVQLVIETHSDHVLNGIRREVRDGRLKANDTKIYFFHGETEDSGDLRTVVDPVRIDERGRLSEWPIGFFDQFESDVDYIFRD